MKIMAHNSKCSKCRNHGIIVPLKGHRSVCKRKDCECEKCHLALERRRITEKQSQVNKQEEHHGVSFNNISLAERELLKNLDFTQLVGKLELNTLLYLYRLCKEENQSSNCSVKSDQSNAETTKSNNLGNTEDSQTIVLPMSRTNPKTSNISETPTDEKKRNPMCARCRAHGVQFEVTNHKRNCPLRNCKCIKCELVIEKRKVMRSQMALQRRQKAEEQMEEEIKQLVEQIRRNQKPQLKVHEQLKQRDISTESAISHEIQHNILINASLMSLNLIQQTELMASCGKIVTPFTRYLSNINQINEYSGHSIASIEENALDKTLLVKNTDRPKIWQPWLEKNPDHSDQSFEACIELSMP